MKPKINEKSRIEGLDINVKPVKGYIYIKDFLNYHKRAVGIIKYILKIFQEPRFVSSMIMLGFESLAKIRYPREYSSKKRFIQLLSKSVGSRHAKLIYHFYRNDYVHGGMLNPFIDNIEDEYEKKGLVGMDWKSTDIVIGGSVQYPCKTLLGIYEELIYYLSWYFNKQKIKFRIIWFHVYEDKKFKNRILRKRFRV